MVYNGNMENIERPNAPIPTSAPLMTKHFFWMLVAAAVLAVACILAGMLGCLSVGGWHRAKAEVVMVDEYTYTVTFDTPAGQVTATKHSNVVQRDVKDGSTLHFRYKEDDPQVVVPYTDMAVLAICLAVAAVASAWVGLSMWREERKHYKKWARVQQEGTPVEAKVINVYNDYLGLTRRARQHYSRLDCAYINQSGVKQEESGRNDLWLFTSERFATPDSKFEGTVTVYVIPDNPDDYYVDLQSLQVDRVLDENKTADEI